jgi:DNA-binding response OmpR family regulator
MTHSTSIPMPVTLCESNTPNRSVRIPAALNLRDRTLTGPQPGQKLRLTHREKSLLVALIQAKNNTLSSGVLCDLYGSDDSDDLMSKHALEELVARLRKKFKAVQLEGDEAAIKSVWGVGYELCLPIHLV